MTRSGERAARAAFAAFAVNGGALTLRRHTAGLIHESWLVEAEAGGARRRYLLQRINRGVFRRPEDVLTNLQRITSHLRARIARDEPAAGDAERRVLALVPTRAGQPGYLDPTGESWRLLPFIEGTVSPSRAATPAQARETALAFGRYARQLADLPAPPLAATIPGFHDTRARVGALEERVRADPAGRAAACRAETDALIARRALSTALDPGAAPLRPVHNDAKIANLLFDAASGRALAVVDLDTTMPGLLAHDFGDLVRSSVSDSAEDERELARVAVRTDVFAALAAGYLAGLGDAISPGERAQLATGAHVIVYEQAVRFLADHLDGDRYYRIERPGHNLDRARAQLRLLEALEARASELEAVVARAG